MRADEITINVKANLEVDKQTAEACLKLVQIYVNAHPEIQILGHRLPNGETEFCYEPAK